MSWRLSDDKELLMRFSLTRMLVDRTHEAGALRGLEISMSRVIAFFLLCSCALCGMAQNRSVGENDTSSDVNSKPILNAQSLIIREARWFGVREKIPDPSNQALLRQLTELLKLEISNGMVFNIFVLSENNQDPSYSMNMTYMRTQALIDLFSEWGIERSKLRFHDYSKQFEKNPSIEKDHIQKLILVGVSD
jgi:hypothetical protein